MTNAATIIEPWMNGDPCDDCQGCERVCRKLQERIDKSLGEVKAENEALRTDKARLLKEKRRLLIAICNVRDGDRGSKRAANNLINELWDTP